MPPRRRRRWGEPGWWTPSSRASRSWARPRDAPLGLTERPAAIAVVPRRRERGRHLIGLVGRLLDEGLGFRIGLHLRVDAGLGGAVEPRDLEPSMKALRDLLAHVLIEEA